LEQVALAVQMPSTDQMVLLDRIQYLAPLPAQAAVKAYLETIHLLLALEETAVLAVVVDEAQVEAPETLHL
jgi:hypothetical protein